MGTFSSLNEARQRSYVSIEEIYRRKLRRSKPKEGEETLHVSGQDKGRLGCILSPLKVVLAITVFVALITLLHTPPPCNSDHFFSHSNPRPSIVRRWIWGQADPRYESNLKINWQDITKALSKIKKEEYHSIGHLNLNSDEVSRWKQILPDSVYTELHLDPVDENVAWDSLYPEWIDEEEESEVPTCPSLPKLKSPRKRLDLIVLKLPCRIGKEKNWSRDVARLHLQLTGAGLAASAKGHHPVHLLFISECFPIPNLITCKELVVKEGNVWLYRPNLSVLREKVRLPVGSCELALPLKEANNKGTNFTAKRKKPFRTEK